MYHICCSSLLYQHDRKLETDINKEIFQIISVIELMKTKLPVLFFKLTYNFYLAHNSLVPAMTYIFSIGLNFRFKSLRPFDSPYLFLFQTTCTSILPIKVEHTCVRTLVGGID